MTYGKKNFWIYVFLVVLLLGVLSGCNQTPSENGTESTDSASRTTEPTENTTLPTQPQTPTEQALEMDEAALRAISDPVVMAKCDLTDLDDYKISVSRHATRGTYSVDYQLYIFGHHTFDGITVYFNADGTLKTINDYTGTYSRYLPYITEDAYEQAEARLEKRLEAYEDASGFTLAIDEEGYLCLSREIIVDIDPPVAGEDGEVIHGCNCDHEHLFFRERICHYEENHQ